MTTLYGMLAAEVEQPTGEVTPYLLTEVPTTPGETRAWTLTKPDGERYRVASLVSGNWMCGCKDYFFRQRRNRLRKNGANCKHVDAVLAELTAPAVAAEDAPEDAPEETPTGAMNGSSLDSTAH